MFEDSHAIVRCFLDMYEEGLYLVDILLSGSASWLRYQQQCLDQGKVLSLANVPIRTWALLCML